MLITVLKKLEKIMRENQSIISSLKNELSELEKKYLESLKNVKIWYRLLIDKSSLTRDEKKYLVKTNFTSFTDYPILNKFNDEGKLIFKSYVWEKENLFILTDNKKYIINQYKKAKEYYKTCVMATKLLKE